MARKPILADARGPNAPSLGQLQRSNVMPTSEEGDKVPIAPGPTSEMTPPVDLSRVPPEVMEALPRLGIKDLSEVPGPPPLTLNELLVRLKRMRIYHNREMKGQTPRRPTTVEADGKHGMTSNLS